MLDIIYFILACIGFGCLVSLGALFYIVWHDDNEWIVNNNDEEWYK